MSRNGADLHLARPSGRMSHMPTASSLAHNHIFQCSYSGQDEHGTRREIVAEAKLTNWRLSPTAWTCPGLRASRRGWLDKNIYRSSVACRPEARRIGRWNYPGVERVRA